MKKGLRQPKEYKVRGFDEILDKDGEVIGVAPKGVQVIPFKGGGRFRRRTVSRKNFDKMMEGKTQ